MDRPGDQSSRWSGAYQASNIKQWMLLKLDQLSILSEYSGCSVRVKVTDLFRGGVQEL